MRGKGDQPVRPRAPQKRSRHWVAAAAAIAVLLFGLGLTEATGVTNFRGTVIRLFSPDGTLVVEVDDPDVSVSIDGEEMVITGTGAKEIRLKPGQYKVLASKDGEVVRQELVTVTRNGRQVVRVSKEGESVATLPASVPSAEQRKALEWVLAIGGQLQLQVAGKDQKLKPGDAIPDGLLTIVEINLHGLQAVDDDTVENLKALPTLRRGHLGLPFTPVSDAGLAKLASYPSLARITAINLERTPISDGAFVHIAKFSKLESIGLAGTQVSAKGLAHLKGLNWNNVTLMNCPAIKDDAMDVVADFKTLKRLDLTQTTITDAGLARVATLPELSWLLLNGGPRITDVGLEYLAKCIALRTVEMHGCNVTEAGLKRLAERRPDLRIELDGRVIEPRQTSTLASKYTNSIGMEFALVPKGKSWLGGGGGVPGNKEIEFQDDFYLGVYEVTQEEWEKVTGVNSSWYSRTGKLKDAVKDISDTDLKRFPVDISWNDAQLFLQALNAREKETGWVYRLPAEVEWEYACRGGPSSNLFDFSFHYYFETPTNELRPDQANFAPEPGKGLQRPCNVGSYKPNRLGLYDMHGNLLELCSDAENPGDATSRRFSRGGCATLGEEECRAGLHHWAAPPSEGGHGLRVARVRLGAYDPERRAAEWVLSIGGGISIKESGLERPIEAVAELPNGPFELAVVNLISNPKVTDAGLAHFKNCKNVTSLDLSGSPVSDAGLANFEDCKNLTYLVLNGTKVSDAGLAHLKDCKNLSGLHLWGTQVSDAGLAHFADCKNVTILNLSSLQVSDAGLAYFQDCTNLSRLDLTSTKVSDAGLANLASCPKLDSLSVQNTKVSETGVQKLSAALPACKIEWDGGVIEPKSRERYTNSIGMEFALVPKGKSWLGGGGGVPGNKEIEFQDDFYLGVYEVTQEEWQTVTGLNPSHFSRKGAGKEVVKDITDEDLKRFPVEVVSWDDARLFLARLNERDQQSGWQYRLPTEAEWEYACRGGPGDKLDGVFDFYLQQPTNELLSNQANYKHDKSLNRTCKVGVFAPNRLGMFDMHGNVWEWCDDAEKNADGLWGRVFRGGGWDAGAGGCRVTSRHGPAPAPSSTGRDLGLRVARVRMSTSDPERRAAEWVLSIGGEIRIKENSQERPIAAVGNIPQGAFELTFVHLNNNPRVSDAELAHFRDCKNLTQLSLAGAMVSDAGLANFKDCKNLRVLNLSATQLSDAGLAHFKDCINLMHLDLTATKVSDAGLANFKNCKDFGLLYLANTQVTDAGLIYFKEFKKLGLLHLHGTQVSDAGLERLATLSRLGSLLVQNTKVSETGVQKLSAALPACRIEWDGGVIEPTVTADPDRRAAEWVLSIGGRVRIRQAQQELDCAKTAELPAGDLELLTVALHGNNQATDSGLAHFQGCQSLTMLELIGTPVTDAGLAHVRDLKKLTNLGLAGTQVSDAGLAHVAEIQNLAWLELNGVQVTDEGLANLKKAKNLAALNLSKTALTDAGLIHLKELKNLEGVTLTHTQVTDAGLDAIVGWSKLQHVRLQNTKVTEVGVKKLAAKLPKCRIEWDGGAIEPK